MACLLWVIGGHYLYGSQMTETEPRARAVPQKPLHGDVDILIVRRPLAAFLAFNRLATVAFYRRARMRLAFLIPAVIVFISSASAEWQVRTYIDPMTDRSATVATLPAVAGQGTLRVACLNGRQTPEISFPTQVSFLRIKTEHRFDDDPVVRRTASVSRDGRELWLWSGDPAAAAKRLARAKRLRVQIFPVGAPEAFVDFDTTGADSALGQVKCK